jgi:hypothetical protein
MRACFERLLLPLERTGLLLPEGERLVVAAALGGDHRLQLEQIAPHRIQLGRQSRYLGLEFFHPGVALLQVEESYELFLQGRGLSVTRKRLVVSGPTRDRTWDQPVMSRPL